MDRDHKYTFLIINLFIGYERGRHLVCVCVDVGGIPTLPQLCHNPIWWWLVGLEGSRLHKICAAKGVNAKEAEVRMLDAAMQRVCRCQLSHTTTYQFGGGVSALPISVLRDSTKPQ